MRSLLQRITVASAVVAIALASGIAQSEPKTKPKPKPKPEPVITEDGYELYCPTHPVECGSEVELPPRKPQAPPEKKK
jgi:hypothetical protein